MHKIGFIGMGNMAGAMLSGCLSIFAPEEIVFSRKDAKKAAETTEKTGVCAAVSNADCAADAKLVILAVKPQFYAPVLEEIRPVMTSDKILVSLAPGYTIEGLKAVLGADIRVICAMPNTPARIGEGMTGAAMTDTFSAEEMAMVMSFFESFGKLEIIPERLMTAVIGASGSSPAFVYMMIEALADAVVKYGMPRSQAYTFAAQAVAGSAKMVLETGMHPGMLKDQVCSPGGTTIEGVAMLEKCGFRNALIAGVSAVCDKSLKIK